MHQTCVGSNVPSFAKHNFRAALRSGLMAMVTEARILLSLNRNPNAVSDSDSVARL